MAIVSEFVDVPTAIKNAFVLIELRSHGNMQILAALQRLKGAVIKSKSGWSFFDRITGLNNITTVGENEIHLAQNWLNWQPFDRAASLIHETRHMWQYALTSNFNFYVNYTMSEMFRLRMEVEALKDELRFYKVAGQQFLVSTKVFNLLETHSISQKHYFAVLEDVKKFLEGV